MTVVNNDYTIVSIDEMKHNKFKPSLSVYRITAIFTKWLDDSNMGRDMLTDMGYGEFMDKLNKEYEETSPCFTIMIPVTQQTIDWNNYVVGGQIRIAYYPENVEIKAEIKDDGKH